MQRKQPTTSEGTERRFSGKSRGLEFGPKLHPNQCAKLGRKIGANCRHELRIAPRWGRNSLLRRILDEIWRRDRKNEQRDAEKPILRKTASRTDETAPVLGEKWVRPDAFAFYAVPASIDGISRNDSEDCELLRRHMGFIAQTEYGVPPNAAAADNRFSGVGAHPGLLTRAC